MNETIVSVCYITYNQVNYVKDALDGILMQKTNFSYEVCIGEDDSDDGTREICIEYAQKYTTKIRLFLRSRNDVIYINSQATGRYNFLETLKECRGKYIAHCDGDDYWTDPLKLQKQVDFMEKNKEYSLCSSRHKLIDKNSKIIGEGPTLDPRLFDHYNELSVKFSNYTLEDYLYYPYNIFQYSSVLFRKSDRLTHGLDVKFNTGDLLLSVNLLKKGPAYFFLDDYFSVYRIHSKSIWNKHKKLQKAKIKVFDYTLLKKYIPEYRKDIKSTLKCLYVELSIEYAKEGLLIHSLYYYILSLFEKSDFIQENYYDRLYNLIYHYKNYMVKN
jgi:glycosyltransferase involved in cell wall biosynthesis